MRLQLSPKHSENEVGSEIDDRGVDEDDHFEIKQHRQNREHSSGK